MWKINAQFVKEKLKTLVIKAVAGSVATKECQNYTRGGSLLKTIRTTLRKTITALREIKIQNGKAVGVLYWAMYLYGCQNINIQTSKGMLGSIAWSWKKILAGCLNPKRLFITLMERKTTTGWSIYTCFVHNQNTPGYTLPIGLTGLKQNVLCVASSLINVIIRLRTPKGIFVQDIAFLNH